MIIRGGRLIDPSSGIDTLLDLRIDAGLVTAIGERLDSGDDAVFDATNAYVAPGFIDMHVHLRAPGQPEKETIATGTAAAIAGGFTAVACMPNTVPALDSAATLEELRALIQSEARSRVYSIGAITRQRAGTEPVDYAALAAAGAVGFSDDGYTVMDPAVLLEAAIASRAVAGRFISHCEDERLKANAAMTLGETSKRLGVPAAGSIVEDVIVARDLLIAQQSGHPWHIAHISTRNAVEFMRWATSRGIDATCEAAPHHLMFTDEDVDRLGPAGKVNPPLRSEADVRALREAVLDGTIDAFATDHAPHTQDQKSGDLKGACVGFSGLEIAIGAYALALPTLGISRYV
ncbi:MAG: dihydroorotase, partial [Candidatus Baltobacteraceae bacterium]